MSVFQYFVNDSWKGFIFALMIYFFVWSISHFKTIVDDWF